MDWFFFLDSLTLHRIGLCRLRRQNPVRNTHSAGGTVRFRVAPPKKPESSAFRFFHLCPQDTTSFACLHATSFRRRRTQMNEVALRANDVLRNDVGLRPMMLRFAQTEFPPRVLKNTEKCAIIKSERRWSYEKKYFYCGTLSFIGFIGFMHCPIFLYAWRT